MTLHKLTVKFGKDGYKQLLEKYGKIDEEVFRKLFYDTVKEKLPNSVSYYESAIDWQVDYLVSESMRKLREGKVFDKYYIFYYSEPEVRKVEEDFSDKHLSDSYYINKLLSVSKRHRIHMPQTRAVSYWKSAKRKYSEKTGKKHSQLTERDYERIYELALKKSGLLRILF